MCSTTICCRAAMCLSCSWYAHTTRRHFSVSRTFFFFLLLLPSLILCLATVLLRHWFHGTFFFLVSASLFERLLTRVSGLYLGVLCALYFFNDFVCFSWWTSILLWKNMVWMDVDSGLTWIFENINVQNSFVPKMIITIYSFQTDCVIEEFYQTPVYL